MQEQELASQVGTSIQSAMAMVVENNEDYNDASEAVKHLKSLKGEVKGFWGPLVKQAHESHKALKEKENNMMKPLDNMQRTIEQKMLKYYEQKEYEKKQEEIRLQKIANEKARKEEERLRKHAASMKTEAKKEEYEEKAEAVVTPVIEVQTETPQAEGVHTRSSWKTEVVDKTAFVKKALEDPNAMAFILLDLGALNKFANATKGKVSYPGLEFKEHKTLVTRSNNG